jgi:tungstate transport system ATP-binding protein
MNELIVELNGVRVERSGRKILSIEHFAVKEGELAAVVGPNGAGKSTLLQVINLLCPNNGKIRLFGQNAGKQCSTELRRRMVLVFQETLFLHDTVLANAMWGLKIRGLSREKCRERALAALDAFHCGHLALRKAHALSGGEAQRVSLARALALEPELLLLDEPFSAQDVTVRLTMLDELRQLAKDQGMAVLLVSHNFSDVLRFAERVAVMLAGKIVQADIPERVLRQPVSIEAAKLAGMDNIIPCSVAEGSGEKRIAFKNGCSFPCPSAVRDSVTACCLPGDALCILPAGNAAHREGLVTFTGTIERILPGVGSYQIFVRAGSLRLVLRVSRDWAAEYQESGITAVVVAFDAVNAHFI